MQPGIKSRVDKWTEIRRKRPQIKRSQGSFLLPLWHSQLVEALFLFVKSNGERPLSLQTGCSTRTALTYIHEEKNLCFSNCSDSVYFLCRELVSNGWEMGMKQIAVAEGLISCLVGLQRQSIQIINQCSKSHEFGS